MQGNNLIQPVNPHKTTGKTKKKKSKVVAALAGSIVLGMLSLSGLAPASAHVEPTVPLGTAGNYSVLAATTVTKNGTSVLGRIGLSPGISVNGLLGGIISPVNSPAVTAQADLDLAYANAARRPVTATVNAQLGGQRLTDGVYQSRTGAFLLDGVLTLDGQKNPNSVFILKADALKTGVASQIRLINGAQACNVFFLVDGSANLGSGSIFAGTILAVDSITANVNAKVEGRLLSRDGAVNLNANVFAAPGCNKALASVAVNVPKVTAPVKTPSVPAPVTPAPSSAAPQLSARTLTGPLAVGLDVGTAAAAPVEAPPVAVPPAVPAPAPNDGTGTGTGTGTDDSVTDAGSGNGTDSDSGTGAGTGDNSGSSSGTDAGGNGLDSGAGSPGDVALLPAASGLVAAGQFPSADSLAAAGAQDDLAQTGASSLLPVAMMAGMGLLLTGIVFIFLKGRRLHKS